MEFHPISEPLAKMFPQGPIKQNTLWSKEFTEILDLVNGIITRSASAQDARVEFTWITMTCSYSCEFIAPIVIPHLFTPQMAAMTSATSDHI